MLHVVRYNNPAPRADQADNFRLWSDGVLRVLIKETVPRSLARPRSVILYVNRNIWWARWLGCNRSAAKGYLAQRAADVPLYLYRLLANRQRAIADDARVRIRSIRSVRS